MMKHEFDELLSAKLKRRAETTQEEYDRIEMVYMNHPLVDQQPAVKQKSYMVEIWISGLINDMYPTAREICEKESRLYDLRKSYEKVNEACRAELDEISAKWEEKRSAIRTESAPLALSVCEIKSRYKSEGRTQ